MHVNHFNGKPNWEYYIDTPAALIYNIYNDNETKKAAIIHWEFSTDDEFIQGDSIDELKLTLKYLKNKYKDKIITFVDDLDLLYQFIKYEFDCETFNISGKGIGVCTIDDTLELREIRYIGTKDWTKFINTNDTPINQLLSFGRYYLKNIAKTEKSAKLPLTIQQVIKDKMKSYMTKEDKENVVNNFPEQEEYILAKKYLYIGGFCDTAFTDKYEGLVGHIDFKTSYVARMLTESYPVSAFSAMPLESLDYALKNYCCIVKVCYTNFRADRFRFLPGDKVYKSKNLKLDENNRVESADKIILYLTELDFELISNCYKYDDLTVITLAVADKGPLPKYVRKVAEECYSDKETFPKDSIDQIWAKQCTEIVYGACATGIYGINDKAWHEIKSKAILNPYWAIWTAAHARYALVSLCKMLEEDWLYSDTDSLFFKNPYLHVQLIEKYNNARRAIMFKYCEENNLDYKIFSELGTFTYEDGSDADNFVITAFKALGPKRYIFTIEKRKIVAKVAGCKKQYTVMEDGKPTKVNIWSKVFGNDEAMYDAFEDTTKLRDVLKVVKNIDEPYIIEYNGKVYNCKSGRWTGYMICRMSWRDMFDAHSIATEQLKDIQKELGREQI